MVSVVIPYGIWNSFGRSMKYRITYRDRDTIKRCPRWVDSRSEDLRGVLYEKSRDSDDGGGRGGRTKQTPEDNSLRIPVGNNETRTG